MITGRILLVEDERIMALHLKQQLLKMGYSVTAIATSGEKALQNIENQEPDLVLMDIHIEGAIDGIETTSRIRAELQIPVIYLTAYADETTLERARATRPYGYLLKPFSERELNATIQMALGRRRADVALQESEQRLERLVEARTAELEEQTARHLESEARLQSILDNAPVAISLKDRAHRYVVLNRQYEAWFGVTKEQQLGRTLRDVGTDEEFAALMESAEDRVLATAAAEVSEVREPDIGTAPQWALVTKFPVRAPDGSVVGVGTVNIDISERRAAERALQAAKDAAEEANRAKSDFLASMSHEIRTPMNGIIGFADLLLDGTLTPVQRRQATLLKDAGKSLLAIINDILDLSKIEAGKLELERTAMNPFSVVDGCLSILRSEAIAKDLELRHGLAPDVPDWIEGDPTRLRQVLLNLVNNALKFTSSGSIMVTVARDPDTASPRLRFEVADTGIGISAEAQHLLFQPFSQVDRSAHRRFVGTGLGLAICRRLVEAMGGAIGVRSVEGQGSVFWFTVLAVETAAPSVSNDGPMIAPETSRTKARILVAEDLYTNQVIVESMLRAAGHDVALVENGAEAVAAVQRRGFDVILMDMEMPVMDGVAATVAIRQLDERTRNIPIIALTANAMPTEIAHCKAAGMNGFLSKPIDREAMLQLIAKWAGQSSQLAVAASRAPASPAVIDQLVLTDIENRLGRDQVASFARLFGEHVGKALESITSATDRQLVYREAHALISLAGNLGCVELMEHSRALMDAAQDGTIDFGVEVIATAAAAGRALTAMRERYPC